MLITRRRQHCVLIIHNKLYKLYVQWYCIDLLVFTWGSHDEWFDVILFHGELVFSVNVLAKYDISNYIIFIVNNAPIGSDVLNDNCVSVLSEYNGSSS